MCAFKVTCLKLNNCVVSLRLFVVHEDCSASELLRAQDVEDLLQKAYCDSSIAVLTDPLPDSQRQDTFHSSCELCYWPLSLFSTSIILKLCLMQVCINTVYVYRLHTSSIVLLIDFSSESFGITLLRPCPDNSHWLSSKQDDDIIPTHLKSRKWESFPASEVVNSL